MTRIDTNIQGLWWADYDKKFANSTTATAQRSVAVPLTGWKPPKELPNLSGVRRIGLDTETKDLNLPDKGPGAVRGDGHIVGVSLATDDGAWYFPLAHEYAPETAMNWDKAKVLPWLQDVLRQSQEVVGGNLLYDLEFLRAEGVKVPRTVKMFDVMLAEPLLDENMKSYALEVLGAKHVGHGKESPQLYQWCADSFGGEPGPKQRANIWRSPPSLVGPYAVSDARLPLQILARQEALLAKDGLSNLYRMECDLIPLLLDMRFRGVRIDVTKAQETAHWLRTEAKKAQERLGDVDVWSGASLERAFTAAGHEILHTEAGNPSFPKLWLENHPSDLAKLVLDVRLYEKAANPFVESYLLGNIVKGRVYCQFHPMRSDEYGTVSGRFSSSNPNLQNIPSRHPVIAPLLRSLFLPDIDELWVRGDYAQIEYKCLVHYAVGKGADELRRRYNTDPSTDFHKMTIDLVKEITGIIMERKPAKNLNFGLVFGMGKDKTTRSLGVSAELGAKLYEAYFAALPSVKETNKSAQRLANRRGFIKTILGRRRRFPTIVQGPYGETRTGIHAALNACLQGSAADILKSSMLACYEAGVFDDDACGIPMLTVHDELDNSVKKTAHAQEAVKEMKRIMENTVRLKVPLVFEMESGENWGACH